MNILVIDIGGSHVKTLVSGQEKPRKFESHKQFAPPELIERVREMTKDWHYDVISLGYPGPLGPRGPEAEPGNLGQGWIGFNFEGAFGKPVRLVNDAAMQALGAYEGGRMLFLGLGTGLGSALVADGVIVPLELGNLPYRPGETLNDRLSKKGLARFGKANWLSVINEATVALRAAMKVDYITLGGGNAIEVMTLPEHTRRGHNADAFTGGFRLWTDGVELHGLTQDNRWRVVR